MINYETPQIDEGIVMLPGLARLPGLVHGVTARGFHADGRNKRAILEKVATTLGLAPRRIVCGKQIHETHLAEVDAPISADAPFQEIVGVDGLIASDRKILIAVFTADCVPVLLVDPAAPRIAVVHAGWRGTLARIVEKAIRRLVELGSPAEGLTVALGPAISQPHYEVSLELAERFGAAFPACPAAVSGRLLDLRRLNAWQAKTCGVSAERIIAADLCSFAAAHCESHRRDGERAGRTASFLMLR